MSRGYFITFEGGEGTGKSTQLTLVDEWLRTLGHGTVVTREPGVTPLAEAVRALLLDPELDLDGLSEIFLLEAARRDHVERVIRPALAEGAVVLCDRFTDSSLVYQGLVRRLGWDEVAGLNTLATRSGSSPRPRAELERIGAREPARRRAGGVSPPDP
jgi:dTMP kinase